MGGFEKGILIARSQKTMTRILCVFLVLIPGALAEIEGCVVHSDGTSTCNQEVARDDATRVQQEHKNKFDDEDDGSMLSLMQKNIIMTRGIKQDEKGREAKVGKQKGGRGASLMQ